MEKKYTVKQLAELAGVSIRTLRYYDKIGLLKPAYRTESGYRHYKRAELLKLQQILFYKELGVSLKEIQQILSDPEFDLIQALQTHKQKLLEVQQQYEQLLKTIDKTIDELQKKKIMKDEEIYEGFDPKKIQAMREEVIDRWGKEELEASENKIRKMGKEQWKDVKEQEKVINQDLAKVMGLPVDDYAVQLLVQQHHQYLNQFYEVKEERYRGLAGMYVSDERFKQHYDQYSEGLAEFLKAAILVYCDRGMKVLKN